jgi:hypothetical protein
MADFATLAVAAETALGFEAGEFMAAYDENIASGTMAALESSPVAQALIGFMTGRNEWVGTATELLDILAPKNDDNSRSASAWPMTGRGMTGALSRLAPALRRVGIHVEHLSRSDAKGTRRLRLVCEVPAQPSEPSEPSEPRRGAGSSTDGSKRSDDSTVREPGNRQRPSEKNPNEFNATDVTDGSDGCAGTLHTSEGSPDRYEKVIIDIGAGTPSHRSFVSGPAQSPGFSLDEWQSRILAAYGPTATVRPAPAG